MVRVQSPAWEITIEDPFSSPGMPGMEVGVDGKVAKGCHSLSGLDEMDRQEKRCIGYGNERRTACEESTCAVKVQRRRRSQGYMSSSVMRVKFQNVGSWMSRVPMVCCGVVVDA